MKKISTLVLFLLTAIMAGAQVDQTFQFIDENGNVVPDGTVITINTLTPDDFGGPSMMAIPLSVKNVSGQRAAVSMYEDIDQKPHGDWTTCAFGNCMALHETGYSAKSIVAGDYQHAITTEWIPEEGKDAVWDAKLQIRVFNIKSESSFGQSIEVPGDEVIGYGPTVTVRFVYGEQAAGEKHWWGYTSLGDQLSSLGVRNPDTYNCAIFIPLQRDLEIHTILRISGHVRDKVADRIGNKTRIRSSVPFHCYLFKRLYHMRMCSDNEIHTHGQKPLGIGCGAFCRS